MEIYNDRLCLTGEEVWAVLGSNFNTLLSRGRVKNLLGRACYNRSALYDVDDFPNNKKNRYRDELYIAYPELTDWKAIQEAREYQSELIQNLVPDPKAKTFFTMEYTKPNGEHLTSEEVRPYENSVMVLNAIRRVWERMYSRHAAAGKVSKIRKGEFFLHVSKAMPDVLNYFKGELSFRRMNSRRLQELYETYGDNNYACLISGNIGNQNRTKKQRGMIERIVVSIYGSKEKPFITAVSGIYNEFVLGLRDIYNVETGEVFNRQDFYHKGEPITVSDSLVYNILNDPLNRKIVDRLRNDFHYNQNRHNAAVDRESPYYSLSKISMDDRDLRRKCIVTDEKGNKTTAWVHAYYAFDVASDTCIGAAYSLKKDHRLVMECFRNMWNNLRSWGLNTPAEVEVENHLMKELSDKLDRTFMHVTICAPMNSREKRAEHKIRAKVWFGEDSEHALGMARGRHYGRSEAYLGTREKVFDELNDTYKEQVEPWDFDRVVEEDRAHIRRLNNIRHTRKKNKKTGELLYDGMTRMQVLVMKQHAELAPLNWRLLCKEWGKCTETSLKKGSTFTVDYREWWLSDAGLIERFRPNDTTAQAYYIPEHGGAVNEIFVYQGERYIDTPRALGKFQEAKIERTAEDERIIHEQLGFIASHKKLAKDTKANKHLGKLGSLKTGMVDTAIVQAYATEILDTGPPIGGEDTLELVHDYEGPEVEDWAVKALNSM